MRGVIEGVAMALCEAANLPAVFVPADRENEPVVLRNAPPRRPTSVESSSPTSSCTYNTHTHAHETTTLLRDHRAWSLFRYVRHTSGDDNAKVFADAPSRFTALPTLFCTRKHTSTVCNHQHASTVTRLRVLFHLLLLLRRLTLGEDFQGFVVAWSF